MSLLLTGAFGFVGKNVLPFLNKEFDVKTLGLLELNDYSNDLSKDIPSFNDNFDVVVHSAGLAHFYPKSEKDKLLFNDVNYNGTINLCKALETNLPKYFVFISTDMVYGIDSGVGISEDYPLNPKTPYAKSKVLAEEYLQKWCFDNNVILTILRPSLIAGVNPPGNLGAMINGISKGFYLSINNGKAKKSFVMVDDIANIIKMSYKKGGIYNVCDNYHPSFGELERLISSQLNKRKPFSIPICVAIILAKIGDIIGSKAPINSIKLKKITQDYCMSNEKAKRELGWKPLNVLENFKIE